MSINFIKFVFTIHGDHPSMLFLAQCRPQEFQTSSLKLLGQSKPNFMWSLTSMGMGNKRLYTGHMTKMAITPIYGKNI